MAMSAEHRSKFAALHRQWWRLHMSEKFSSRTINSKQTNKSKKCRDHFLRTTFHATSQMVMGSDNTSFLLAQCEENCALKFKTMSMSCIFHIPIIWKVYIFNSGRCLSEQASYCPSVYYSAWSSFISKALILLKPLINLNIYDHCIFHLESIVFCGICLSFNSCLLLYIFIWVLCLWN